MNLKATNNISQQSNELKFKNRKTLLAVVVAILILVFSATLQVYAGKYDQAINQLRQDNGKNREKIGTLNRAEETLETKITGLQNSIAQLEKQITDNTTKSDQLKLAIEQSEKEIKKQQSMMKINVRLLYLEGDMSTLEMLVGSKDLSDYLDKEQYRSAIQGKILQSFKKITALKNEQQNQQTIIDQIVQDQTTMRNQVVADKAEAGRLLSLNQEQQTQVNQQIQSNNAQISNLQRAQALENERLFRSQRAPTSSSAQVTSSSRLGVRVVNGRNYPWAQVAFPNSMPDPWGMYKRQCVSYTAWMVASSGRYMPYWGGRGNAKQWPANARNAGIPVDRNPRVGDVAVSTAGTYGHVMYVEAIYADSSLKISQYNANWTGSYSEDRIFPGSLEFIHF